MAGSSPNAFTYTLKSNTKADNYSITKAEGTLTVTPITDKVTVTITENSGSEKYDGTEKTVTGYKVTSISNTLYTANDFKFSGDATVKGTDAGTYEMKLKPEDFQNTSINFTNVEFVIVDGTLEIAKRSVTLTSATDSKVYDSTPLTNDEVTVGGDGFADGEGVAYDVTGSQTETGSSANEFTYTLNEGTKAANYDITKTEGMLTVTPITDKVTVTITENSGSEKYDGTEKTVTGYTVSIDNELYTEADFIFSGDATVNGTNAGSYDMELKPEDFANTSRNFTNVEFIIEDGMLEIVKRSVTLTSATDEKEYDGTPLTNDTVTVTGDGFADGEGATYDVTGSQTEAGSSDNTFTYELKDGTLAENYEITTVFGTLTVTQNSKAVAILSADGSWMYDGEAHSKPEYTVKFGDQEVKADETGRVFTLPTGDKVTISKTATVMNVSDTKANNNTYSYVLENADQYKTVTAAYGKLEITKRGVTMTSATDTKMYDGTPLTNDTVTVTGDGFVKEEGATYDVTGSQTEVGGEANNNTFTYELKEGTLAENYEITTVYGTLTVTEQIKYTLTIRYWKDREVISTVKKTDVSGTAYDVVTPPIKGYTADKERIQGILTADVEYDVFYTPIQYQLTIRYLYQNGDVAARSYKATLKYGEKYSVKSPVIDGYTTTDTLVEGKMPAKDLTITVIYVPAQTLMTIEDFETPLGVGLGGNNTGETIE